MLDKLNVLGTIKIATGWNALTGLNPEKDVNRAREIFANEIQTMPSLIVIGHTVELALVQYYLRTDYNNQYLRPYLEHRTMPPRWFDMKMLVIPVEFELMFPELFYDVWVIYRDNVVILKDIIM